MNPTLIALSPQLLRLFFDPGMSSVAGSELHIFEPLLKNLLLFANLKHLIISHLINFLDIPLPLEVNLFLIKSQLPEQALILLLLLSQLSLL